MGRSVEKLALRGHEVPVCSLRKRPGAATMPTGNGYYAGLWRSSQRRGRAVKEVAQAILDQGYPISIAEPGLDGSPRGRRDPPMFSWGAQRPRTWWPATFAQVVYLRDQC